ncbi:Hypothetical predicted protein [Xyrichtys novacula]|uniref:Uncharacterized protein n=1 Tax=Xyrichtys novacula TaxID=13765 RepID=A0AAV1HBF3_XYRNO|nr:Hypothetical predicted protein [Xyrichtys novacula]
MLKKNTPQVFDTQRLHSIDSLQINPSKAFVVRRLPRNPPLSDVRLSRRVKLRLKERLREKMRRAVVLLLCESVQRKKKKKKKTSDRRRLLTGTFAETDGSKTVFLPSMTEEMCQPSSARRIKRRASLSPFHAEPPTATAKEKKKRREREKKGHDYVGAAEPTAGGSDNQSKQRRILGTNEGEREEEEEGRRRGGEGGGEGRRRRRKRRGRTKEEKKEKKKEKRKNPCSYSSVQIQTRFHKLRRSRSNLNPDLGGCWSGGSHRVQRSEDGPLESLSL